MNEDTTAGDEPSLDEIERLRNLYVLDLTDSPSPGRFDRYTRIACHTFGVPIAHVTLLDDTTQWLCTAVGDDPAEIERSDSFCTHLIDTDLEVLVVEDAQSDERFAGLGTVVGDPYVRFYAGAPVSSPEGHRIGTICVVDVSPREFTDGDRAILRDLAKLVEIELHHIALSTTDELTGLSNLRAFRATARQFMRLGERRGEPVTIMFADVDGLKAVNDDFGHLDGDQLLRRAAEVLLSSIRRSDMAARVGGDEFAIVAYGLGADETAPIISAVETAISISNRNDESGHLLSISIGTATSSGGESVDELIGRADSAMYAVKNDRADGDNSK